MIIKEVEDDILNAPHLYLAHGVNCRGIMDSGVATKYPWVKEGYIYYVESMQEFTNFTPTNLLGNVWFTGVPGKCVINCFTQESFDVDYEAVRKCFEKIVEEGVKDLAIPRIGCGLAGGDWNIVREIINDVTRDKCDVMVYNPKRGTK